MKEHLNWSLWMNWETHEIGRHTFVCVYLNIFLGKGCKAFIDCRSGPWPPAGEHTQRKPRKLLSLRRLERGGGGEGASCAFSQLERGSHYGSWWSFLYPYPHGAPVLGLGHGSSRRSLSSQTVSAFQFMPVSGLTEAHPFLFSLNLWVSSDISLHSTKLHNIIFERSAIPL